jgi:aryl-alcohol dehydrogenase-like predicted oxidoreductase
MIMQYRALGATGIHASVVGLGSAQLSSSSTEYAVRMVHRALELGINYFDTARGYGDSEVKIGLALQGDRERAILSTKTYAVTRDDARRHIDESLQRLQTDYLDNCHLHGLTEGNLEQMLGPGGALEALVQAKEEGLIRHIGASSHHWQVLMQALERYPFEIFLVMMNLVEYEPLAELLPLCAKKGVGVTVMKPVATGLLPSRVALRWLLNQKVGDLDAVHVVAPGATTLEELEENALAGYGDLALTAEQEAQVPLLRTQWERARCRCCDACNGVCAQKIGPGYTLGTDVGYDHYRTMGPQRFRAFSWSREAVEHDLAHRRNLIAAIEACDHCGKCEAVCRYGLPVMEMLPKMLPAMRDMVAAYDELLSK